MKFSEKPLSPSTTTSLTPVTSLLNVLIVDGDAQAGERLKEQLAAPGNRVPVGKVRIAGTPQAAELEMRRAPADVVFVSVQLQDNGGIDLIRALKRRWPRIQAVAVSRVKRSELCLEAWRAGASDLVTAPLDVEDLKRAFGTLDVRRSEVDRLSQRNERLRTVCRRLNKARHEISQQVDLLCNDLVRAYQEIAQQLNFTQTAADFAGVLKNELEIEGILRKTMEWILAKLGPVNAAVYLPNGEDAFSLGAYLNLDTQADAALIEALGQTLVQQARGSKLVSIDSDRMLEELYGSDGKELMGRVWHAIPCSTARECLGVLVIFRTQPDVKSGETGHDGNVRSMMEAMAPVLAQSLEEALGFFQRMNPPEDLEDGYGEGE